MPTHPVDPLQRIEQVMAALDRIHAESSGVQALMRRIVDEVMRFTGGTGAVVEQVEGDFLVYVSCAGSVTPHVGLRLPQGSSLSGLCVRTRETQHCTDTEADPRVNREACRAVGARSMMVLPLQFDGRVIGVLKALSDRPAAFTPLDEQMLRLSAGMIASALGRQTALDAGLADRQKLSEAALTDPLTGLPNRRAFDDVLEARVSRRPDREDSALCFIDLNRFKAMNDKYGHQVGDAALRQLAGTLRAAVRGSDHAARLAGDEFVVLLDPLRDDPPAQCSWFARKLLQAVESAPLECPGLRLPLSISLGIALRRPGESAGGWLTRADAAMYNAKRAGDNRFVLESSQPFRAAG